MLFPSRLALVVALIAAPALANEPDSTIEAVGRTLRASADAWSRGDLHGFIDAYEDSAETTYVSGERLVRGRTAIEAMFRARFGAGPSLGALTFDTIAVTPLGADHAFLLGRYHLRREEAPEASGYVTLVMHRAGGAWRILTDHTS